MIQTGDTITNPVTGETMTFLRTRSDDGGALAILDLELTPTAQLAAEHIHRLQEETFESLEGKIRYRLCGEEFMESAGETVAVPAGAPHAWAPVDGGARIRVTLNPGNGIENFFDEFFRLAREGKTNNKGIPQPLAGAPPARARDVPQAAAHPDAARGVPVSDRQCPRPEDPLAAKRRLRGSAGCPRREHRRAE